ncbi:SH3 domain-containing protein 19 isoform X3 [Meles meles]|uniref:SH3 domain-containing protein 19 isoform X3 n=1 Tax=Meles meles TaxID=9662 RepID=UPI001E69DB3E|nr:SH3 domain-containing protein 19 isoform X3 [Meles meles]
MGFLLTPECRERAGRGQVTSSFPASYPIYLFCTRLFWSGGRFQREAVGRPQRGNPSPGRRGLATTRPIPAPTLPGGEGKEKGGKSGRLKAGEGGLWCAARRRGKRPARARPLPRGLQVESAEVAAAAASPGPRALAWSARCFGPGAEAHGSPAVPGLRLCASSMAEGRRREDEEEELRERREFGGPRRARGRALSGHSAADRNERNKPEHRSSSQGPLSSIRAVIKRSSRTSFQSEHHRDRRRPEITIVAAEPLRPASWFPGAPPPGLGFPPSSAAGSWRPSELVPAELPPSYEQVIKEINQVQVNTTNNNNAAATPRHTITSATQTDFPEEIDNQLPQTLQAPLKPLQPSWVVSASDLPTNAAPLIVFDTSEEQNCPENSRATRCPVPRPRSKANLRPVARDSHIKEQNHQKSSPAATDKESSLSQPQSLLDITNNLDSQAVMNIMNTERSQNSVVSRIKAFEGQTNKETSGPPAKPEIAPRTLPPRPALPSGKPSVAPKPAANRASGEWDSWTKNRLKVVPREGLTPQSPPQEVGSIPATKPELPKKPNAGLTRSINHEILGGGPMADSPDGGKKVPTPAPRPLLPKKSVSLEIPNSTVLLKPVTVPPRLSVASQAKAFRSLGEGPPAISPAAAQQSKPPGEIDLISFDDDVLPTPAGNLVEESVGSEMVLDPFQLPIKTEPTKERAVQPVPTRKPTVIRIPAKPGKCLHEDPQSPPPLPTEKPIGNTCSTVSGKLSTVDRTRNLESDHVGQTGGSVRGPPRLPPRPVNGKVIPARQPPHKGAPERPPPPKLSATRASSKKLPFNRSSSDMDLQKKQSNLASGLSKAKSQVFRTQDPVLPPRPKPGHPLYRKYMLSVPHGIANEDIVSQNPGELSCKRGDVLVMLKQAENNYLECQKGEDTGRVHLSQIKIITPLDEHLRSRPNDPNHAQKPVDSSAPHAVVLHDFPAEQADDLHLTSGEIVYLLEKIDPDWYRGRCRNQTGIFPANYVRVIIDVPEGGNGKRESVSSHCVKGPRCVARFEYIGDQKDELSFSEGEIIILKEYVSEEWARGELRDRTGIFPLNFVELLEDHPTCGTNVFSTKVPPKTKKEDSGANSQDNSLSGEWCEALHSFTAETSDDLSFRRGDRILILERVDSDWYKGRLRDREGIFPAVFVRPCPAEAKSMSALALKGKKAKALYDFHGENEDELSFKAGDIITELESVDDDWMSGELMGKSGIFPKNYVQFLQVS